MTRKRTISERQWETDCEVGSPLAGASQNLVGYEDSPAICISVGMYKVHVKAAKLALAVRIGRAIRLVTLVCSVRSSSAVASRVTLEGPWHSLTSLVAF